jgi:hypothetical protein
MGVTRFRGPVYSTKGFRFTPALYGDRPMTIVATSVIRPAAASGWACTLSNAAIGGLNKVTAAWANYRQTAAATTAFLYARPLGAANSVVVNAYGNVGTGQIFHGRAGTIDVFIMGYCS